MDCLCIMWLAELLVFCQSDMLSADSLFRLVFFCQSGSHTWSVHRGEDWAAGRRIRALLWLALLMTVWNCHCRKLCPCHCHPRHYCHDRTTWCPRAPARNLQVSPLFTMISEVALINILSVLLFAVWFQTLEKCIFLVSALWIGLDSYNTQLNKLKSKRKWLRGLSSFSWLEVQEGKM